MKYNVGDLFQAGTGFIGEWIDNKMFIIQEIHPEKPVPFVLYCLENGRRLETTAFTLHRDMKRIIE